MLRAKPEVLTQVQQRLRASGLSQSQVRARLRAAGYPESLLDQVMPGGNARSATPAASDSMVSALRSLGIVDSTDAAVLRRLSIVGSSRNDERLATENTGPASSDEIARAAARTPTVYPADGSTLFGLDIFAQATSLFDPNAAGPVDASYLLGPGDQIVLILTGDVEEAYTLDVTREGFVVVPVVGQVGVANMSLGDLDAVLRKRLARVYSGIGSTTRFSVSVSRLRSNQVFVAGDVQAPGSYRVSSAGTALTALYAAGGPTERGSLRNVEIRRRGRPAQRFDVYDYLLRGDASRDVRLENGDVLFVPTHGARVRIQGGVLRPATYELKSGETLEDLVKAAGGFTADASRRRIRVQRILPPSARTAEGSDRMVIDVAAPNGADQALSSVKLEAGDIVEISRVSDRVRGRIAVKGNVWQPGTQGITPGTTLAEALRRAGGLKPDSYLGSVVVSRLKPDSTREQLRATLRDTTGATVEPLLLQEDDEITVYSLTEFRAPRFVAISGAVLRPGQYPWRDGMTMRDLVLQAGGLAPSALLEQAEIARLPLEQREGTIAQAFRVKLDSSYVVGSSAAAKPEAEIPLSVYDNVLILRQPDWQLQSTVVLTGEVRYPGTYSLMAKSERLSDLIKRAGGLTANAYSAGIVFLRRHDGIGRVGVDLPQVLRNDNNRDNLLLIEGDSIHVPRFNALVEVSGAVNSPLAVPYEPGASLEHYIRAAGGATRQADSKRAFVRQANGKVESSRRMALFFKSVPKPSPGSEVIVPARDASERRDIAQLLGTTAQVLGSLVTVVVVLSRTK